VLVIKELKGRVEIHFCIKTTHSATFSSFKEIFFALMAYGQHVTVWRLRFQKALHKPFAPS